MIIEISVAIIAVTLVVWVSILTCVFFSMHKGLKSVKKNVQHVANEAIELMHKTDDLIDDIQSKSESLDIVFKPLKTIKKGKIKEETSETVGEVVEWVSTSLSLFNRLRHAVKKRGK